jgi:hypothetical protein
MGRTWNTRIAVLAAMGLVAVGVGTGTALASALTTVVNLSANQTVHINCAGNSLEGGNGKGYPVNQDEEACVPSSSIPFRTFTGFGQGSASVQFSTSGWSTLDVAFVAASGQSDGPQTVSVETVTPTGNSPWGFQGRSNTEAGDVEIWQHTGGFSDGVVTATASQPGAHVQLTIMVFLSAGSGAGHATGIMQPVLASGSSGAPSATVTPMFSNSRIWAVGIDPTAAVKRGLASGQVLDTQNVDSAVNQTFWVQHVTKKTVAGTPVVISDASPTNDSWNLAAVEVYPSTDGP